MPKYPWQAVTNRRAKLIGGYTRLFGIPKKPLLTGTWAAVKSKTILRTSNELGSIVDMVKTYQGLSVFVLKNGQREDGWKRVAGIHYGEGEFYNLMFD